MGSQAFSKKQIEGRTNLWKFDPFKLVVIGIDTKDGPEHPLWDERIKLPIDEAMVLNIMAIGVKETVTIRKEGERAEVVDGRRRVMHSREANRRLKKAGEPLIKVPCSLEHGSDEFMEVVSVSLNEIRLDDETITKANKAARMTARGHDDKAVAIAFGVTTTTIKNWRKLIELAPKVRKAVAAGEIAPSAAIQLHGMEKDDQVKELKKLKKGASKNGKAKVTTRAAKKATGKTTAPGKRVLKKLVEDEVLSAKMDNGVIHGIKLALGLRIPDKKSKMGKLLRKAGYTY